MTYQKKINDPISCPLDYLNEIMGGKWKSRVICCLSHRPSMRYTELRGEMVNITDPVLAGALKELIADGIVHRHSFNEVPPHVEYSLTKKGKSLLPVLQCMCEWADLYFVKEAEGNMKICEHCRYHGAERKSAAASD